MLYDFEPYAAFKRIDQDDDGEIYTLDFYNYLRENDVTQFSIKDCQLLMQFYDLDAGGSLSYEEFMKFILPCDNMELREEACQRKTYKVNLKAGQKLHSTVEKALTAYLEQELNCHVKMELLKKALHSNPDFCCKAAFNILDSQKQGYLSHPQLYSFIKSQGIEASNEELIAIVRRIDSSGDGMLQFHEFKTLCEPIILKTSDILEVQDQGPHLKQKKYIEDQFAGPLLRKSKNGPQSVVQPFGSNLDDNLRIYDEMMAMGNYAE